MNKKITATLIITAAALGAGTFEARADTVNQSSAGKASSASTVTQTSSAKTATSAASQTHAAVSQAQKNVSAATSSVSTATEAQSTAQVAASSAAQAASDETTRLSQLSPDKLNQEKAAATKAVADDTVKVQTTTTDLTADKSQAASATSNVASATSTATVATSDLQQAKDTAGSAQVATSQANVAVNTAEDNVNQLQEQMDAQPKVKVDGQTWKSLNAEEQAVHRLPLLQQQAAEEAYESKAKVFMEQVKADNSYTASEVDRETKVANLNAVTQEQWADLTRFALVMINQLLAQWNGDNSHNITSTLEDITLGQQFVSEYGGNTLLEDLFKNLSQQYDFDSATDDNVNPGSDFTLADEISAGTLTIGNMKEVIYRTTMNWTEVPDLPDSGILSDSYLALGIDDHGEIHEIMHTPFNTPNSANTTLITPVDFAAQLATAKADLATKTAAAKTAAIALDQANTAVADATDHNEQAQASLQAAQQELATKVADVQTLTAQLTATQMQLAKDLAWLASLNQTIANLKAAIAKQTDVVAQAQEMVVATGKALNDANSALVAAKVALQRAQMQLTAAQANDVNNHPSQPVVTTPAKPVDVPDEVEKPSTVPDNGSQSVVTAPTEPVNVPDKVVTSPTQPSVVPANGKQSVVTVATKPIGVADKPITFPTQPTSVSSNGSHSVTITSTRPVSVNSQRQPETNEQVTRPEKSVVLPSGKPARTLRVLTPAKLQYKHERVNIGSYQPNIGGTVVMPIHQSNSSIQGATLPQTNEKDTGNQGIFAGVLALLVTTISLFGFKRQR